MTVKDRIDVEVDSNGYTFTRLDGKLHSVDDVPSSVSADGSEKLWHKNGRLHREGGKPAFIREEAIKYPGTDVVVYRKLIQEWYRNGLMSRDGDLPTEQGEIFKFDRDTGLLTEETFYKKWYKGDGVFHRDNGKPAFIRKVVSTSINNKEVTSVEKQWFNNGKIHSYNDKPNSIKKEVYRNLYKERAVTYKQITKKWLIKGEVLHRDRDKPASVVKTFHFKNGQVTNRTVHQRWYVRGFLHRDDGKPAFIFNTENIHPDKYIKSCAHEEGLYLRGVKHSVDDKPSHFRHTFSKELDGRVYEDWELEYHRHDQRHREGDKPAVLKFEIKDGVKNIRLEEYYYSGEEHRDNGLPSSSRDEYNQTTLRYCVKGKLHRVNEPALIVTKKNSFFYGFYENDIDVKDCFDLFSEILLKKLVSVAPDEFNDVKVGDYPVAQLASILFALTGDKYSSTVLR